MTDWSGPMLLGLSLIAASVQTKLTLETVVKWNTTKAEDDPVDGGGYNSGSIKRVKPQSTLSALLQDPILSDLLKNPTLSDVDTLISLELGGAMRISIGLLHFRCRGDEYCETVKDLKMAVKKKVVDLEQSQMGWEQLLF